MDLTEITSFYKSVLKAWAKTFKVKESSKSLNTGCWRSPLFHNPVVHGTTDSSKSVQENMLRRNCTKLKDLVSSDGWKSVEEIMAFTGLRSRRLATRFLEEYVLSARTL